MQTRLREWTETGVATSGRYRSDTVELDCRSVCRKIGVSPEVEMDVVTRVELEMARLDPELHLCLRRGQAGQG